MVVYLKVVMSDSEKKVVSIGSKAKKNSEKKETEVHRELEYCSFCGRPNTMVPKLVKGPGVNICSECTLIAVQYLILQDGALSTEAQRIIDMLWGTKK